MNLNDTVLFQLIRAIINESRQRVYRIANSALLQTYWQIGQLIVDDEQQGKAKAIYGEATLKTLATQLTLEFGKGFDYTNLTNMRKFYLAFPIIDALRQELSWTHYRLLSRIDTEQKRNYYLQESFTANWNSRNLQRQINSLAFERVVNDEPRKEKDKVQKQECVSPSLQPSLRCQTHAFLPTHLLR